MVHLISMGHQNTFGIPLVALDVQSSPRSHPFSHAWRMGKVFLYLFNLNRFYFLKFYIKSFSNKFYHLILYFLLSQHMLTYVGLMWCDLLNWTSIVYVNSVRTSRKQTLQ